MIPLRKLLPVLFVAQFFIFGAPLSKPYVLTKDYKVTIHGSSNLHDWDENVQTVSGLGAINLNADGSFDLKTLTIKIDVRSIKSDKGAVMNNNTYKALKVETYPQIIFTLTAPLKSVQAKSNNSALLAKGNLSIAGITKAVSLQIKVSLPEPGKLAFEGSQALKMSDFNIKPPTALLGALKTGNEISINFKTGFVIKTN